MATYTPVRAEGQLSNVKGTLYTAPALTQGVVKTITLVNPSGGAITVNIYFKNATSRRIIPKDYSIAAGGQFEMDFVGILQAGDLIEGDASSATTIDYWISILERV